MTAEQNARWQEAIPLLDYLDFHALSDAGLQESDSRLRDQGVPEWAIWFRSKLIDAGWNLSDKDSWVPDFALRSEVALIGLQIRYPKHSEEAEMAVRRLLLRFIAEQLRPFVTHARRTDWYRRSGYKAVVKLFQVCEQSSATGSIATWPNTLTTHPPSLFWDLLFRLSLSTVTSNVEEFYQARCLGYDLFSDITSLMRPGTIRLRDRSAFWNIGRVLDSLTAQHWLRMEGTAQEDQRCSDLIAVAYLAALEAECPTPSWLQLTSPC